MPTLRIFIFYNFFFSRHFPIQSHLIKPFDKFVAQIQIGKYKYQSTSLFQIFLNLFFDKTKTYFRIKMTRMQSIGKLDIFFSCAALVAFFSKRSKNSWHFSSPICSTMTKFTRLLVKFFVNRPYASGLARICSTFLGEK